MLLPEVGEVVALVTRDRRVVDGAHVLRVGRGVTLAGEPNHAQVGTLVLNLIAFSLAFGLPSLF